MRLCISIRGYVHPSVGPSVRPSVHMSHVIFRRVLGASCAVYPALFFKTRLRISLGNHIHPFVGSYIRKSIGPSIPNCFRISTKRIFYSIFNLFLSFLFLVLGECVVNKNESFYPLIAKLNYLTRFTKAARTRYNKTRNIQTYGRTYRRIYRQTVGHSLL